MRNTLLHGFARLGLTLALGLLVTLPVRGTSFDTNSTDLWWNPSESGWGVQLLQEADVIFATMYVYDASNVPTWYVALLNYAGNNQYTGALLATHGPWFGNPSFNPGLVSNRVVGQMTYTLDYVEQGRLSYTVDGVPVSKTIYRMALKDDNYVGEYMLAYKETATGCFNPANNGTQDQALIADVTQGTNFMRLDVTGEGFNCVYVGDYLQSGQFGKTRGTYSCSTGETGNYVLFEMNVNRDDVRGRLTATNNQGCTLSGAFAGLRR